MRGCRFVVAVLVAGLALVWGAEGAFAQTQSLFGNRGPTSSLSRFSGATSGLAATPLSIGGFGTGAGTGFGMAGTTGQFGLQPGATTGGTTGFIGRNNQGRFIGNRLAGQQTGGSSGFTGRGRGITGRPGGVSGGINAGAAAVPERLRLIRPVSRIAFDYPRPAPTQVADTLAASLSRAARQRPALKGVSVELDESGTAVLTGEVESDEARKLAAALIRLEPGVRSVRNELAVKAPSNE